MKLQQKIAENIMYRFKKALFLSTLRTIKNKDATNNETTNEVIRLLKHATNIMCVPCTDPQWKDDYWTVLDTEVRLAIENEKDENRTMWFEVATELVFDDIVENICNNKSSKNECIEWARTTSKIIQRNPLLKLPQINSKEFYKMCDPDASHCIPTNKLPFTADDIVEQ